MFLEITNNWKLKRTTTGEVFNASVPGDITIDLYNAGKIQDPYFGMNHKDIGWIPREDFEYTCDFDVTQEVLSQERIELVFDGIDLFAEVHLNGKLLGKTENMFLQYRFDVTNSIREHNRLVVSMKSTVNAMEQIDTRGFFGVFNLQRLFIRKAQCHFGWDWAPDICGYGIWNNVYLDYGNKYKISDVSYVSDTQGNVSFIAELNYNLRAQMDTHGNVVSGTGLQQLGDKLVFAVSQTPFGSDFIEQEIDVSGQKNLCNFNVKNVKLWWPHDYGEQPLYNYKVTLIRDGKTMDEKQGRLAFRTVDLLEKPVDKNTLGYTFAINGKQVYVKGSNWVPVECFTGTIQNDKYRKLIDLAKSANANMLRVWGGGIYEKDFFYDYCDEQGMLVWQDVMLSCGDIPEDDSDWVNNMVAEVEYQVKRLRNHPSIIYWCGGNEKTGSYGLQISRGDFFVNYTLQGLVRYLDKSRPFARQSPCSHTDVGNDLTSGESHYNSFERSLTEGVTKYRKLVSEKVVPFVSECAIMGANSVETAKKIFPVDKLWPMNEVWHDRLMDNPYAAVLMDFAHREDYYAGEMYGKPQSLVDFTAKSMQVHAEMMRTEIEWVRSHNGQTSGFLNWMFSDIWPTGTWAIVDYFLEPKQVYYQMKKSFSPLLATFVEEHDGTTNLVVVNDHLVNVGKVTYGVKNFDGKILQQNTIYIGNEGLTKVSVGSFEGCFDKYLFVEYCDNGEIKTTLYSPNYWRNYMFQSDYEYFTNKLNDNTIQLTVKANKFAKSVFVSFNDNYKYLFSDNYFDVEQGTSKTITITSEQPIDEKSIVVTDFAKQTN